MPKKISNFARSESQETTFYKPLTYEAQWTLTSAGERQDSNGQTPFVNRDSSTAPRDSSATPRTYAFCWAPLSTRPARGHVADCLDDKETSRRETVFGPVDVQTPVSHFLFYNSFHKI
jgi:hypothetical protein